MSKLGGSHLQNWIQRNETNRKIQIRTHPIADDKNNNDKLVSKTTADLKPTTTTIHQKHESTVPSSRLSRLWHYGGLATGMAFGAMSEGLRRATGVGDNNSNESSGGSSSLMMSAGNMDRLVSKLSTMRGAALKLGQMMSFQGMCVLYHIYKSVHIYNVQKLC